MKMSEQLELIKPRLSAFDGDVWDPARKFQKEVYICLVVDNLARSNIIPHSDATLIKAIISARINNEATISLWLKNHVWSHKQRSEFYYMSRIDRFNWMQQYRHEWLDRLINECKHLEEKQLPIN